MRRMCSRRWWMFTSPTCVASSPYPTGPTLSKRFVVSVIGWRRGVFRGLRLRLTVLYLLAALALMALIGAGSYWLLDQYFKNTTDLALQHKMVETFRGLGVTPPPAL